uniref:Transposase n=1 Tax=Angiostrongylus cantonensis TaxID=6313 RepID=A0A0K0CVK9_ANGCA
DGINQWDYIVTGFPRLRRFRFVYNIDEQGSAIRLRLKLLQLQKYMRKNVRKPVTLKGNPEVHNGSYASYWCT